MVGGKRRAPAPPRQALPAVLPRGGCVLKKRVRSVTQPRPARLRAPAVKRWREIREARCWRFCPRARVCIIRHASVVERRRARQANLFFQESRRRVRLSRTGTDPRCAFRHAHMRVLARCSMQIAANMRHRRAVRAARTPCQAPYPSAQTTSHDASFIRVARYVAAGNAAACVRERLEEAVLESGHDTADKMPSVCSGRGIDDTLKEQFDSRSSSQIS